MPSPGATLPARVRGLVLAALIGASTWLGGCSVLAPDGASAPVSTAVAGETGLRYERDTRHPDEVLHWLRLDLRDPHLRLTLTTPAERERPLDAFDGANEALAAVNASFFSKTFQPRGPTLSQGQVWPDAYAATDTPLLRCDRALRCAMVLTPPYALADDTWLAVAGTPWLVRDGHARQDADDAGCAFCIGPHPRTAVGLDASGRWLTIVVAEGRRGPVAGLSLATLARRMAERGVTQAFNLDGGGSSSLLIEGRSTMARPFNEPALRRLANALLIRRSGDSR